MTAGMAVAKPAAEASCAGVAEAGESVDDAPNRAEQSDERRDRASGSQPRHSFFHATHFFRARHLHISSDGLQALQFWRMRLGWLAADLAMEFAVARGVHRGKRRAGGSKPLRISNTARGAEDAQELIALPANASE